MQKAVYYIVYPLIWLISKLPFFVLYRISDLLFVIIFYVVGYRKKLVYTNIQTFFPEKSHQEILKIRRKFYLHFSDLLVETIKTFTISSATFDKHFTLSGTDVLDKLAQKKQSIITVGAHYANWEWTIKIAQNSAFKPVGVYKKINNPAISDKIKTTRERFGMLLVEKEEIIRVLVENYKNNILSIYGFISDQSPVLHRAFYWTDFLGKRVPVYTGAENTAKKYNHAVVFFDITKLKRGYYNCEFKLITDEPTQFPDYQITDRFLKMIEEQIRKQPEYYLWSHNRFKLVGKEHLSPAKK